MEIVFLKIGMFFKGRKYKKMKSAETWLIPPDKERENKRRPPRGSLRLKKNARKQWHL